MSTTPGTASRGTDDLQRADFMNAMLDTRYAVVDAQRAAPARTGLHVPTWLERYWSRVYWVAVVALCLCLAVLLATSS